MRLARFDLGGRQQFGVVSGDAVHPFPEALSALDVLADRAGASRGAWIRPGDLTGVGTCGSGCLAESWGRDGRHDPPPLKAGDVVTRTAEGIGTLTNTVVEGPPPIPIPRAACRERVVRS